MMALDSADGADRLCEGGCCAMDGPGEGEVDPVRIICDKLTPMFS